MFLFEEIAKKTRWHKEGKRDSEDVERHEDDDVIDIYQEEIKRHQSFMISDGAGLTEVATRDMELMEQELRHSKKRLQKSKRIAERQE
jgi:hypothetical protein